MLLAKGRHQPPPSTEISTMNQQTIAEKNKAQTARTEENRAVIVTRKKEMVVKPMKVS